MAAIARKLSGFMRTDRRRQRLLIEALLWLGLARLALLILPFRVVASWLGERVPLGEAAQRILGAGGRVGDLERARQIGWAVRLVATHAPFRAVCLQQAIAAKFMLRRCGIPSVLYFGVAPGNKPEKKLAAHAWLNAAHVKVTGYPVAKTFTTIACFF